MSINVTGADFRKRFFGESALGNSLIQAQPLDFDESLLTYDGTWLKISQGSGQYKAIKTGHSLQIAASIDKADPVFCAWCRAKANVDSSNYLFFFEPHKGGFSNYQGLDNSEGTTHYARSKKSTETKTNIDPQDWTAETEFMIKHEKDDSDVYFYIDGAEEAHHTTNISSQPYEVCCCEGNGVARQLYLKYPPGIALGLPP